MNGELNLVTIGIFVIAALSAVFSGVKIVPQGEKRIVQRLGKYHRTLRPGLNFIVPYVDTVPYRITTKDIVLDIPSQEVITRDNVVIIVNAVAYINVVDPQKAVYGVEDYNEAIQNLIQTSLRAIVGEMKLDDALSSRDQIKLSLKTGISDDISDWGIVVKTVEIRDINPSTAMQVATEEQAAAERSRRAAVTRAEGEKQAVILEAEGMLEASRKEAEAKVVLANASAQAITTVSESIDNELPVMYLLGERYMESIRQLAESDNAKTVVYPADLQQTVKGIISTLKP